MTDTTGNWWMISFWDYEAEQRDKPRKSSLPIDKEPVVWCRTCDKYSIPYRMTWQQGLAILAGICTCRWQPTTFTTKQFGQEPYETVIEVDDPGQVTMVGTMAVTPTGLTRLLFGPGVKGTTT